MIEPLDFTLMRKNEVISENMFFDDLDDLADYLYFKCVKGSKGKQSEYKLLPNNQRSSNYLKDALKLIK